MSPRSSARPPMGPDFEPGGRGGFRNRNLSFEDTVACCCCRAKTRPSVPAVILDHCDPRITKPLQFPGENPRDPSLAAIASELQPAPLSQTKNVERLCGFCKIVQICKIPRKQPDPPFRETDSRNLSQTVHCDDPSSPRSTTASLA